MPTGAALNAFETPATPGEQRWSEELPSRESFGRGDPGTLGSRLTSLGVVALLQDHDARVGAELSDTEQVALDELIHALVEALLERAGQEVDGVDRGELGEELVCLLYTSPSPRDS